jgi:ABC-type Fe3+-hydroxamate transport system substrate-binding protein
MNHYFKEMSLKKLAFLSVIGLALLLLSGHLAEAKPKNAAPAKKIKAIMVGDRLVDVAYNLGVLPEAMVVRCSMWPMCNKLGTAVETLGCLCCVTVRDKTVLAKAVKRLGINRIIIEKHPNYYLYKPEVKPTNVVPLLSGMDLTIEYVDFSPGLESAIRQTAELLGRQSMADTLINRYHKALDKAKQALPKAKPGKKKKVVIISGLYQGETGKTFLRVESPGGYSDRFLLEPLGCVNVGDSLKSAKTRIEKGHFMVRKLDALAQAKPNVIIMTGDAFAVQKALSAQVKENPTLSEVPAIKNLAIYSLPFYADSSVIEYPAVLMKWTIALAK